MQDQKTEKKRLQNVLSHSGVASRRGAAVLIEEGKVKVDGEVITEKGFKVDPNVQDIVVEGKAIVDQEEKCYFLFNKPKDVVSTAKDTHDRKKVVDFFLKEKKRVYPIGRLDKDTTGLLLVTNDGVLTHKLSHPSFEVEKEYKVTSRVFLKESDIRKLERGIVLDGKKTARCNVKFLRKKEKGAEYLVKLHEGRKRHIRRMFQEVGSRVADLKRIKYAGLDLAGVEPGEYRKLTDKEVNRLKDL